MELSTRVWSGTTEGLQVITYKYIFTKEEEKQQLVDCVTPLLVKKVLYFTFIMYTYPSN